MSYETGLKFKQKVDDYYFAFYHYCSSGHGLTVRHDCSSQNVQLGYSFRNMRSTLYHYESYHAQMTTIDVY